MAIIKLDVLDVQGRKLQAYADLDIAALAPETVAAADDAIHLSIPGELATLPAATIDDDDIFLFEDASDSFAKKKLTRLELRDSIVDSVTLDEAYKGGGVSDGRKIDLSALTGDPVWLWSENLTADFALHVDWDSEGDLGNNPVGMVIIDSSRTLNAGSDGVSDNFVNFEVTRKNVVNLGGQTFASAGSVQLLRILNTQTAGTLSDSTNLSEWRVPSAGTFSGHFLSAYHDTDAQPRFRIDGALGTLAWGPGGSTTVDTTLGRAVDGYGYVALVCNRSPFDIRQPTQAGGEAYVIRAFSSPGAAQAFWNIYNDGVNERMYCNLDIIPYIEPITETPARNLGDDNAYWRTLYVRDIAARMVYVEQGDVTISANQNNYNIEAAANGVFQIYRVNATTDVTITGMVAPYPYTNRTALIDLVNVGSGTISLPNESGLSSAANQFLTGLAGGGTATVDPNDTTRLWYDRTTQRWRVLK